MLAQSGTIGVNFRYTPSLADQGAASGVRVNSVIPGIVHTDIVDVPLDEKIAMTGKTQLIERLVKPEEVSCTPIRTEYPDASC